MNRITKLKQLYDSADAQMLKPFCNNKFVIQKQQQQTRTRPQCPLTMEKINRKDLYVADCLHCFDKDSIQQWVEGQKKLTCPLCKQNTIGFMIDDKYYLGNRHLNNDRDTLHLGGWVAHTARVGKDVLVKENALVYGNARVRGNVEIKGRAKVYDNAQVKGNVKIMDDAQIYGNAFVLGTSHILENAKIYGNATVENSSVFDEAQVYGNSFVDNNCEIQDHAHVYGHARIAFQSFVRENAKVYGDAKVLKGATVRGNASVSGNALVSTGAEIEGNAKIGGKTRIIGDIEIGGNVSISQDVELKNRNTKKITMETLKQQVCVPSKKRMRSE